jgi:hypothetical protein
MIAAGTFALLYPVNLVEFFLGWVAFLSYTDRAPSAAYQLADRGLRVFAGSPSVIPDVVGIHATPPVSYSSGELL